jgi:hypothetical protein
MKKDKQRLSEPRQSSRETLRHVLARYSNTGSRNGFPPAKLHLESDRSPNREQFLQSKRQGMGSTKPIVALLKPVKGDQYGIPDFSCRRINDGALLANYSGLFETARMVTDNCK